MWYVVINVCFEMEFDLTQCIIYINLELELLYVILVPG